MVKEIVKILDDKKANNIKVYDVRNKSSFTDYFIVASGSSTRQTYALSEAVEEYMDKLEILPNVEGKRVGEWILLECGDIIVNIFINEARDYYKFDELYSEDEIEI